MESGKYRTKKCTSIGIVNKTHFNLYSFIFTESDSGPRYNSILTLGLTDFEYIFRNIFTLSCTFTPLCSSRMKAERWGNAYNITPNTFFLNDFGASFICSIRSANYFPSTKAIKANWSRVYLTSCPSNWLPLTDSPFKFKRK